MNNVRRLLSALLAEPRVANAPKRSLWDWVLVAFLAALLILGFLTQDQFESQPLAAGMGLLIAGMLPWRRSNSLLVFFVGFGLTIAFTAISGTELVLAGAVLALAILVYSLTRWASGRHIAIGSGGILLLVSIDLVTQLDDSVLTDFEIGSRIAFWLLPIALGLAMRNRSNVLFQRRQAARHAERELLARELHDAVAHHVSAIAIQAQAGRAVGAMNPEAVAELLGNIAESASLGLSEMRKIVGALRQDEDPLLNSRIVSGDFERLAENHGSGPRVELELRESLDNLSPSIIAAFYRIAQESVTNARRHAVGVTRIVINIEKSVDQVRLTVTDDGEPTSQLADSVAGLGIIGMAERVKLLGGTFTAAPGPDFGWVVTAELPVGEATQ